MKILKSPNIVNEENENMTFEDVMELYTSAPYDRLVRIARRALGDVCIAVAEYFKSESDVARFLVVAIGASIATDGSLTELERRFARDVMGDIMDDSLLDTMADLYNSVASRAMLDEVVDALDTQAKMNLCAFCACFVAVDRSVTHTESDFVRKLLS